MAYYRWAAKVANPKWRRTAYLLPVVLLTIVSIIGLLSSPTPEPESAYVHSAEPTAAFTADPIEDAEAPKVQPDPQIETEKLDPEPEPYGEPEAEAYTEPYIEPEPVSAGTGYIAGTCSDLKARGLAPFYPGDANYTSKRDRDNDAVACE